MASETLEAPLMRKDAVGSPIPALALDSANTESATVASDTAVSLTIPSGCKMVEIASLIPLYIDFSGTATATSHVFPAGVAVYKVLPSQTTVSVKRVVGTDTGPVTLTPLV